MVWGSLVEEDDFDFCEEIEESCSSVSFDFLFLMFDFCIKFHSRLSIKSYLMKYQVTSIVLFLGIFFNYDIFRSETYTMPKEIKKLRQNTKKSNNASPI